jgi:hypothetical protein
MKTDLVQNDYDGFFFGVFRGFSLTFRFLVPEGRDFFVLCQTGFCRLSIPLGMI